MRPSSAWTHALAVTRPALALAHPDYLDQIAGNLRRAGVQAAVARRDSAALFDWMMVLVSLQGISDRIAFAFDKEHGGITWSAIETGLAAPPRCSKLRCHWTFSRCGYRKSSMTCAVPALLPSCALPRHDLRKGVPNRASYGLYLFLRDVCDGDLVGWLDQRLADAGTATSARVAARDHQTAATAVVAPLAEVDGIGLKVAGLMVTDLLLAGDPRRAHWIAAGAQSIVVDTLVHNFLHRSGILRRFDAAHPYGSACYAAGGCADIIAGLAQRFDARRVNPRFPATFPRLVQEALWRFCAVDQQNVCNGIRIGDRHRCRNASCAAFAACDRVRLGR